jgi:hypothetical protein
MLFAAMVLMLAVPVASAPRPPAPAYEFASLPWGTTADAALERLQSMGYVLAKGGRTKDGISLSGRMMDRPCSVHGTLDDKGVVQRWHIVIPGDDYTEMRRVYDDVTAELARRLGASTARSDRFEFPFRRGDGREAKALERHMAAIHQEWAPRGGDRVRVSMTPLVYVETLYESRAWRATAADKRAKDVSRF